VRYCNSTYGASLGEVIVGLGVFALLSLAVVGTLARTADLEKRDTGLTETTFLLDSLLEAQVSKSREFEGFSGLASTPDGEYWTLEDDRPDGLQQSYLYRVEVEETVPALKKVVVSVYHRKQGIASAEIDPKKGQSGRAVSAGTRIGEPSR
jgi:hypothetical protein